MTVLILVYQALIILPDQYTSTNYQMIESTQKILEKLIINHVPNEYTVNY